MTSVLEIRGLGKRYGRRWALRECTLAVPGRRGRRPRRPNGACKPPCCTWL